MPRVKRYRLKLSNAATLTKAKKTMRSINLTNLDRMTSAELLDVYLAVKEIEKGICPPHHSSPEISLVTRMYRNSTPAIRKRIMYDISKTIVERNARENPATPEMIAKLKKAFE